MSAMVLDDPTAYSQLLGSFARSRQLGILISHLLRHGLDVVALRKRVVLEPRQKRILYIFLLLDTRP
jgi:hypothetical protein